MKDEIIETSTVREAIIEGYLFCGDSSMDFSSLIKLTDVTEEEIASGKMRLVDIKTHSPKVTEEWMKDLIGDSLQDQWSDETGDDTEEVLDIIKAFDFSETVKLLNEKLLSHKIRWMTNVVLINEVKKGAER